MLIEHTIELFAHNNHVYTSPYIKSFPGSHLPALAVATFSGVARS